MVDYLRDAFVLEQLFFEHCHTVRARIFAFQRKVDGGLIGVVA